MNHWFGSEPFAQFCKDTERVPAPIGTPCSWCEEPISEGQNGIEMLHSSGPGQWWYDPMHHECMMRSVIGSIAHIEGRCFCFTGVHHEPEPGMSKRQEALIVFERWHAGESKPPTE